MTVSGPSGTTTTLPATTPGTVTDQGRVKSDGSLDTTPDRTGFLDSLGRGAVHTGDVSHDLSSIVLDYGTKDNPNDGFKLRTSGVVALVGTNTAAAGLLALKNTRNLPEGTKISAGAVLADTGNQFMINGLRVTPTLVSAVVGPALADGISYIAPALMPKYKNSMKQGEKSNVQIRRAVVAAAAVGLGAGIAFLVKPDLFKSAGFLSDMARNGGEEIVHNASPELVKEIGLAGGVLGKVGSASGTMRVNEAGQVIRTLAATGKNGAFANRTSIAMLGGLGTMYLGYKTYEAKPEDKWKWGAAAAVTGAVTALGAWKAPQLTRGATEATNMAFLPQNGLIHFKKPNIQWIKEFASKIVPITAAPAGMSAYSYLDVFNDFDQITGPRSPFKGK